MPSVEMLRAKARIVFKSFWLISSAINSSYAPLTSMLVAEVCREVGLEFLFKASQFA